MTETGLFELETKTIARVAVDVSLAHLDRLFDYESIAGVVPGCRVMVRFAGRKTAGYVVEVVETNEYHGKMAKIETLVSAEPVLTAEVYALARAVADRYGGVLSDVLRNAIPPRHARTENAKPRERTPLRGDDPERDEWAKYENGTSFLTQLSLGDPIQAVMSLRPDHDKALVIATAVHEVVKSGRGVVVCVPDARDISNFAKVFSEILGPDAFVTLTSGQPPAQRYESFLAVLRGQVQVVLGTRNAAYSPVKNLGLVVMLDDGDDLYVDQRAPYAHAREVLLTRAMQQQASALLISYARSCEAQRLVQTNWAISIEPSNRKTAWPRVAIAQSEHGERLPHDAFVAIRAGLETGPVLIQVPRRGYRAALSCQECRTAAKCDKCQGPLIQKQNDGPPTCNWCGHIVGNFRCKECGSASLRAPIVGAQRLAEEIGKAFPQTTIKRSAGDHIIDEVDDSRAIVISTPGAEPTAPNGFSAGIILDTSLMLGRPALRVNEEAHRRWFNAMAKVAADGQVVVVGAPELLQALVRVDPIGFAERELADREAAHLPPAANLAVIEGAKEELLQLEQSWPEPSEVFGPVFVDDESSRLIVRVPQHLRTELSAAIAQLNARRSSQKQGAMVTRINPYDI